MYKRLNPSDWSVYFVTDRAVSASGNVVQDAFNAARACVPVIQYREKHLSFDEKLKEAREIKKICNRFGVAFVVNDDVKLAIAVRADGIHVGQTDMSVAQVRSRLKKAGIKMIVGTSVSNDQELTRALVDKPDYLGVGPIYRTSTKSDAGKPVGINYLARVCRQTKLPVIAIGGITSKNLPAVLRAGACGAAMISEIAGAPNISQRVFALQEVIHQTKKNLRLSRQCVRSKRVISRKLPRKRFPVKPRVH